MKKEYLYLIIMNLYWGLTQVLMKHILQYMGAATYVFLRFGSAFIVMLIFYLIMRKKVDTTSFKHGLILGIFLGFQTLLNTYSLYFTSTSNSVFIGQLTIIAVPSYYFIKQRKLPDKHFLLVTFIMICGLMIFSNVFNNGFNKGDIITFGSMLLLSVQLIIGAKWTRSNDILSMAIAQMLSSSLVAGVFAINGINNVVWCSNSIMIIVLTGIIGSGIMNTLRLLSQAKISVVSMSLINILHPIFSMIGAAIIPNIHGEVEVIYGYKVIGAIIMISGLLYYLYTNNRRRVIKN